MSIRLGEYVEYGEFWNTRSYGTHGFLVLRTEREPDEDATIVRFELTGDCDEDFRGKHIRFEPAEDDGTQLLYDEEAFKGFNRLGQVGPTGRMSTQGWVRALPCSVEEFCRRAKLGEPPPTPWRNHLYLEWFGPNGRVTVEMAGATVEYCTREPDEENEDDDGAWAEVPNLALPPDTDRQGPGGGVSITKLESRDNEIHVEEMRPMPEDYEGWDDSDDLQHALDAETMRIDNAIAGEPDDDTKEGLKRMDYCMEVGEKKPFDTVIGGLDNLPRPDDLDDVAVEAVLKGVLARLVMIGVVLDVCDHFTPRDCYKLLLDEIIKGDGTYEELVGTGWVQHFSTWEYCKACEKELDEKFEAGEYG